MSLPLLYWASEVTKDPRFRAIAVKHGLMAARHFIQKDGSVRSIVRFDPETGEWIDPNENEDAVDHGCGKAGYDASEHAGLTKKTVGNCACISRQQAMALYGFTISFFHTGEADFLKAAEKTAAFLLSCVPGDDQNPGQFAHDHAGAADDACRLVTGHPRCSLYKHTRRREFVLTLKEMNCWIIVCRKATEKRHHL